MPIPTPFHRRTSALCESHEWRDWSGYLSAATYEPSHEREYYALRNAAGLIDVSPLYKYDISGTEATRAVSKIITREVADCQIGQIIYSSWCDETGKMIDDGTVWRLGEDYWRITAADPSLRWFEDCAFGMDARVIDRSRYLAALALQGPNSRAILSRLFDPELVQGIRYYRLGHGKILLGEGQPAEVTITRTGYTGDLGYELWLEVDQAESLWDVIIEAGRGYGLLPVGMVALDIARIEAGLLLIDVDYSSSMKAIVESRKSSPFEAGLGWTVAFDKGPFVGRRALASEKEGGSDWAFVGLEMDWITLEKRFAEQDLPPAVAGRASREPAPLYDSRGRQIGQITSRTFSPILKKYIALGTVRREFSRIGRRLEAEITVEFSRTTVPAWITGLPFYNPPHKKS